MTSTAVGTPTDEPTQSAIVQLTPIETSLLESEVIEALKTVYDPEIPVDIYELGLVYDVHVDDHGAVGVRMTLTSPMCPVAESLPVEVEQKVRAIPGVTDVRIDLVWEPPWSMDKMSEAARLELGFF